MIAVNAENGWLQFVQGVFQFLIPLTTIVVCAHIAEQDDRVFFSQLKSTAEGGEFKMGAVNISGIVNHVASYLAAMHFH